jgi:hypothetical protein
MLLGCRRMGKEKLNGSRVAVVGVLVAVTTVVFVSSAYAARPLATSLLREIADAHVLPAPNGGDIASPKCISGRLSTVSERWASVTLTNTPSCVARYGGASGEEVLLRRPSSSSSHWRRAGSIGDNCSLGHGGAPLTVGAGIRQTEAVVLPHPAGSAVA